jgi:Tol biopolymer transport system component
MGLAAATVAVGCLIAVGLPRHISGGRAVEKREQTSVPAASPGTPPSAHSAQAKQNGDWIAYSTTPGNDQTPRTGGDGSSVPYLSGSDIFLVREGREPRLVAGRGAGKTWNVCPAFSPDGTMLAFGTQSPRGRAVRVVGVTPTGEIVEPSIDLKVAGSGVGPCPRWSSDGSRLAYLSGGKVIVRALDGSSPLIAAGDPGIDDFGRGDLALVAPAGNLVAHLTTDAGCALVVARPDGSDERSMHFYPCMYAVAAWSPDGRKLLVMEDVSGRDFTMFATSVDAPFDTVPIVQSVRVNHGRSWPGRGDVSWQPTTS